MTGNFGGGAPDGAGADDSIESLLGAYALDAVSGDERLQVDMLLERSPSARAELATMQVAALKPVLRAARARRHRSTRSSPTARSASHPVCGRPIAGRTKPPMGAVTRPPPMPMPMGH